MELKLKNEDILKTPCEIYVSEGGTFFIVEVGADYSDYSNRLGHGDTLEGAIAQAKVSLRKKKVKVSISFLTIEGKSGEATGIHASTGNILVRINGRAEQVPKRDIRRPYFKASTKKDDLVKIRQFDRDIARLQRERSELINTNVIYLADEIRAEQKAGAMREETA